jgi:hypothetical protein
MLSRASHESQGASEPVNSRIIWMKKKKIDEKELQRHRYERRDESQQLAIGNSAAKQAGATHTTKRQTMPMP